MNRERLIEEILSTSFVLQIATSENSIPWICSVCFAYDKNFTLYWFSRISARHSQEIMHNPHVAGAIAYPYMLGDKSRGLQFDGNAMELKNEDGLCHGLAVMQTRFKVTPKRAEELKNQLVAGKAEYGLYALRPNKIILHDKLNLPEDSCSRVYEVHQKARQ